MPLTDTLALSYCPLVWRSTELSDDMAGPALWMRRSMGDSALVSALILPVTPSTSTSWKPFSAFGRFSRFLTTVLLSFAPSRFFTARETSLRPVRSGGMSLTASTMPLKLVCSVLLIFTPLSPRRASTAADIDSALMLPSDPRTDARFSPDLSSNLRFLSPASFEKSSLPSFSASPDMEASRPLRFDTMADTDSNLETAFASLLI